jgi:vitamin B12 transporter
MKKFINLSLGLSLVPFFALSSVNAQEPLNSAEGSPEIEEILVSASLIPIAANRSANAITVIDSEQIKLRAAQSVSDLLRDVPGLAVSSYGPLGSLTSIRSRGSESNHLLVLVDGVKANDPSRDDAVNWGTLSVADIERIEVIRGPQSVIHGSDAIAGVVNIITSSAKKPFAASLFSEYGSRATSNNGFSIEHKSEKLNIRLGGSHIETDGINVQEGTGNNDIDGYRNTGVNLKAAYKVNDQLIISLSAQNTNGISEWDDSWGDSDDYVSKFKKDSSTFSVSYNPSNSLVSHSLKLSDSDFQNTDFVDGAYDTSTKSNVKNYQYTGSLGFEPMSQSVSLALGHEKDDFKKSGGYSGGELEGKFVTRKNDSVALEYRFRPFDLVTLAASTRHDDNSIFDESNTHRVEAIYQQSDNLRLRSAWGTAIKNPTHVELYGIFEGFTSNPNLIPELSESYEVGFDSIALDDRLDIGFTYFKAELENEIDGYYTVSNLSEISTRKGIELSSSFVASESLLINGSYTYTDSKEGNVEEVRRAKHIGSINAAWQVQGDLKVNINIQHNGTQRDAGKSLASYNLVNINANYNVSDKLDTYISLTNLFDEDYEQVYGYETLGFGANLGVRYKLK